MSKYIILFTLSLVYLLINNKMPFWIVVVKKPYIYIEQKRPTCATWEAAELSW